VLDKPRDDSAGGGAVVVARHDGAWTKAHRNTTVPLEIGRSPAAYAKRRLERWLS
jgi:hypothetical protein